MVLPFSSFRLLGPVARVVLEGHVPRVHPAVLVHPVAPVRLLAAESAAVLEVVSAAAVLVAADSMAAAVQAAVVVPAGTKERSGVCIFKPISLWKLASRR